ncbi:MAG TPA: thioesterase family protein [Bdellovibrionota bacterium]|jgi:acyl-CoA thioester hydrolase|nr:thioesterase family protein [Bdellovibrionota bacterium]
MTEHVERVRVRYAETDQMGVVYHGQYLVWLDITRTAYLEALGYSYKRLEEEGFFFVVREAHLRYRRPAKFDDYIDVKAWVTELTPVRFRFQYELDRGSERIAEGWTELACVDRAGKPQRIPGALSRLVTVRQ